MLQSDSFLMQVPHALESNSRLILDSAAWVVNSILISFADLEKVAEAMPIEQSSAELEHRLFVHCWSIVDQCHMLRSLLRRLPSTPHPEVGDFIAKTEAYTMIRNSMDHLPSNLNNLANSQQQTAPLFGALAWIRVTPSDIVNGELVSYAACSVSTGSILGRPTTYTVSPALKGSIPAPASNFHFQALHQSVDLSALIADIHVLLQHFETVVRPRVENNIRESALALGVDAEEQLKLRGSGGLKMALMILRVKE